MVERQARSWRVFRGTLKLARIIHRKLRMMKLNVRSIDHTEKEFEDKQTG